MSMKTISPAEAKRLMDEGGVLVDIREPAEHAQASIPGAVLLPLSTLGGVDLAPYKGGTVLFHCKTGMRTKSNAVGLAAAAADCEACIVDGGLDAWAAAGLPVSRGR